MLNMKTVFTIISLLLNRLILWALKYSFTRFVTVGKNSGRVEENLSCDVFILYEIVPDAGMLKIRKYEPATSVSPRIILKTTVLLVYTSNRSQGNSAKTVFPPVVACPVFIRIVAFNGRNTSTLEPNLINPNSCPCSRVWPSFT